MTVEWFDPEEDESPLEGFAHSRHGREIYQLHDNGFQIADSQTELTFVQKFVYMEAKSYWEAKMREDAKEDNDFSPSSSTPPTSPSSSSPTPPGL